jgi:hypothetical protein
MLARPLRKVSDQLSAIGRMAKKRANRLLPPFSNKQKPLASHSRMFPSYRDR